MRPRRIQMTRQRPWRHEHPDAVIVARPGKWGNPHDLDRPCRTCPGVVHDTAECRRLYLAYMHDRLDLLAAAPAELGGRDLACWCPLDAEWCHATDLLVIANP